MYKWLVKGWCSVVVQRHKGIKVQKHKGTKAQRCKGVKTQKHGMDLLDSIA